MSIGQIVDTLRNEGFGDVATANILSATIRARRAVSKWNSRLRLYYISHNMGYRIVLRSNGVARCEWNSGRVRGGIVVAVVNR